MQAERHGKQPPHGRVEAVEGAEASKREVELKDASVFGGALGYRFLWIRLELNGRLPQV